MTVLYFLSLTFLPAIATSAAVTGAPPFIPVYYATGGYPKIMADIAWGQPKQAPKIPTVVDLGSSGFWTYGKNATINYGSRYHFTEGPCNVIAYPSYDYAASKTATTPVNASFGYSYGGNAKLVGAYFSVNDTMHFGNSLVPSLPNRRVAVSNTTEIAQGIAGDDCAYDTFTYDHSILGISSPKGTAYLVAPPFFRQDLLETGLTESLSMSMWFDKSPSGYNRTTHGTVLFGAVPPPSKYSGELVRVNLTPPDGSIGYYFATPNITGDNVYNTKKTTTLPTYQTTECLLDSGSGIDSIPVDEDAFVNATGLISDYGAISYNGSCDSIPEHAKLHFTFIGATPGKNVTVSLPIRNYAHYSQAMPNVCPLALQVGQYAGCVLAAPFTTALFLAVNDDNGQVAIAQGGVSKGAQTGTKGLGEVTWIPSNGSLPRSV